MKSDLDKILSCSHHDPFQYLGAHFSDPTKGLVTLRTFQPHALSVKLLFEGSSHVMENIHKEGVYEITLALEQLKDPSLEPYSYQYEIHFQNGSRFGSRHAIQIGSPRAPKDSQGPTGALETRGYPSCLETNHALIWIYVYV